MENKKRRPSAVFGLGLQLFALMLALYLTAMAAATWLTARCVLRDLETAGGALADRAGEAGYLNILYSGYGGDLRDTPWALDYAAFRAADLPEVTLTGPGGPYVCTAAAAVLDGEGGVLQTSGNYIYYRYKNEDTWLDRDAADTYDGAGRIDLSEGAYRDLLEAYLSAPRLLQLNTLAFSGDPSGPEPRLGAVYGCNVTRRRLEETGTDVISYNDWTTLWTGAGGGASFFAPDYRLCLYDPGGEVEVLGRRYGALLDALLAPELTEDRFGLQGGMTEAVVFDRAVYSLPGSGLPDMEVRTAVRARPLAIAVKMLRRVYLLSLIVLAAPAAPLLWLKRRVLFPMEAVGNSLERGWYELWPVDAPPVRWREPAELRERFLADRKERRRLEDENARLRAAGEYARQAEADRRRMTSNIAHELKTPLAVIHSYAEGLRERIAENKRDRYVEVILSEAERADRLVMEMLDLSRLEAGRVELRRSRFSLAALTRRTFEKLDMAARARGLLVEYRIPEELEIDADEARMGQVIENFASNAVKYARQGGRVIVKLSTGPDGTTFSVENEGQRLPEEALARVWDTFYRADESRSGEGTGLGLAIARRIVDLHGGSCFARNTEMGVEFGFTLR